MVRFANGRIPGGRLVKIGSGADVNGYWEHQISPATLRKWQTALDYARRKWGKVMRVSTGWNCYRPIAIQADARRRAEANGEPNSAARAGWSSHGGTWVSWKHTGGFWVDAMAIDVVQQQLTWAQVDEAMRYAGFLVGAITKDIAGMDEPWHYIDLDPWAAVPSGGNATPATTESEEDDMTPDERKMLTETHSMLLEVRDYLGARGGHNTKTPDTIGHWVREIRDYLGAGGAKGNPNEATLGHKINELFARFGKTD